MGCGCLSTCCCLAGLLHPPLHGPNPVAGVWGYWSTDGLGVFEYMLLAEELRTEPVWVINNGVAHGDSESSFFFYISLFECSTWVHILVMAWLVWVINSGVAHGDSESSICQTQEISKRWPNVGPHPGPITAACSRDPRLPQCASQGASPRQLQKPQHTVSTPPLAGVRASDIMPWVQSALDSIEFITGPPDSKWGSVRAAMGRAEPWQLNYMAIGNEVCIVGLLRCGLRGSVRCGWRAGSAEP